MSGEWNAEDIAGEIRVLQIRQKELKQKLKNLPKGSPEKFAIREAIDNVDNQIERKERRMKKAKMKGEAAQFDADFFFATARNNSISTPTPKGSPGESTGTKRSNHRPGQSVPRRKSSLEDDDVASVIGSTGDNRRLQSEIERLMMEQGQLREALVDTQAAHRTDTELSRALEESQAANKRRLHEVSKLQKALVESRKHYKDTMDAESLRVRDLSAALEESGEVVQKLHIKISDLENEQALKVKPLSAKIRILTASKSELIASVEELRKSDWKKGVEIDRLRDHIEYEQVKNTNLNTENVAVVDAKNAEIDDLANTIATLKSDKIKLIATIEAKVEQATVLESMVASGTFATSQMNEMNTELALSNRRVLELKSELDLAAEEKAASRTLVISQMNEMNTELLFSNRKLLELKSELALVKGKGP